MCIARYGQFGQKRVCQLNKVLVAVFDSETATESGLQALRGLHAAGEITLHAVGVMFKNAQGQVALTKTVQHGGPAELKADTSDCHGTRTGLPCFHCLPMGPLEDSSNAFTARAVRDFWLTGVGMDVVEVAERYLHPGTLALLAEIEEVSVGPVNAALAALNGHVFRRTRAELAEAQLCQEVQAFRALVVELRGPSTHLPVWPLRPGPAPSYPC